MTFHGYSLLLLMCLLMAAMKVSIATEKYAAVDASEDDKHENRPRLLGGFFSRPKPDAQKQHGGFKDHLGNVFGGGSIGFQAEFKPLAPIHDLINQAKNILPKPVIPGFHKPIPQGGKEPNPWWQGDGKGESGGKPEHGEYDETYPYGKPKPEEYDETYSDGKLKPEEYDETYSDGKPKPEEYDETYPEVKPKPEEYDETYPDAKPKPEEYEEPKDWAHKDPKDVNTNGPRWEDIGEDGYGDATSVPIEKIIQPRSRPKSRTKRRVESKVFHVPIEFISNAKPYLVKFGSKNEVAV